MADSLLLTPMSFLPKLPSPQRSLRWLRARPRRWRTFKRWMIVLGIIVVAAVLERPVSHVVKGWQARRLASEAMGLMEKQEWTLAAKKTRDAYQIQSSEPATWIAIARLFSKTGQNASALEWWQKITPSRTLSAGDRRDYAAAALASNELALASEQIDLLLAQKPAPAPVDLLLAGQLATLRGDSRSAVAYAEHILSDSTAGGRETISAAAVIFTNLTPQSPSYATAVDRLIVLARDDNNPTASLTALELLAQSPPRARLTTAGPPPLTISSPASLNNPISRKEVAERLEKNPNARPSDRLLALNVRLREEPNRADEYTRKAIESFRSGDDDAVSALANWLYDRGKFEAMLEILPLDRAARRRDLYLERADALNALGRYQELEEMLSDEHSVLEQALQHVFLAVAHSKLGEQAASDNEWQRAVQGADTAQKLVSIAQYAEANGAPEIADAAYAEVLTKQPRFRSAYLARLRLAESMGQTADAQRVAKEITQLWPDDMATRVREIYLRLLLNASGTDGPAAEKELASFANSVSLGWNAELALVLAHLRAGHAAAALDAANFVPPGQAPDAAFALRAAAFEANGWKDKARDDAKKLTTAKLMPEERALIAPLLKD